MAQFRDPKPLGQHSTGPQSKRPGPLGISGFGRPTPSHDQSGGRRDTPGGLLRQTWELRGNNATLTVLRYSDLRSHETYTTDFRPVTDHLDEWLDASEPRKVLFEMRQAVFGGLSPTLMGISEYDAGLYLKRQLEEAFRLKRLVILVRERGGLSGAAGTEEATDRPRRVTPPVTEARLTWIEIELIDDKNQPVPKERYRIERPDGAIVDGLLDGAGHARLDDLIPGTCQIMFPDIDGKEWNQI